jgi:hypothetical protein
MLRDFTEAEKQRLIGYISDDEATYDEMANAMNGSWYVRIKFKDGAICKRII